ncbi:MAG TPA: FAD-dependent oxidoreductase [Pseudonocardia sp.]|jgi:oxygen-dependent protoporphyrinogen oxidase|nr:FAD-dependent oxidoreductase [Pseudonocardia sp.]
MRAAVVGAGLSGLTAAYRLQQAGWDVEVFESGPEVGGRVRTVARDGYLVDVGASALATSYDSYFQLAGELGIRDDIRPAAPCVGIFRDGRVHEMRMDRLIRSGLTTRVLSPLAKLRVARLAFDLARAVRAGQLDYADMRKSAPLDTESAGGYARRALGAEVDDYLCSPITRTMLIADTQKVSKVELFSGIANIFASQISALRGGQGRLPRTLAEKLEVRLDSPVTHVADVPDGVEVTVAGRPAERFDACVIAAPLPVAATICPDRSALLAPLNARLDYTTGITVALGFGRRPDTAAMLVQLPTSEDPDVALMFVEHNKCSDRAPAGKGLIGTCWETDASARWMDRSDADIVAHTARSVRRVFGDLGEPEFSHVTRWERALPMTSVGAYRLIGEFNAAINPGDRIQFTGDYLSAAGQHTAIEFGGKAAARLVAAIH